MPTFNSIAEIEKYLTQCVSHALEYVETQEHKAAHDVINDFYGEYSPRSYRRTGNLRSLPESSHTDTEFKLSYEEGKMAHNNFYPKPSGFIMTEGLVMAGVLNGIHGYPAKAAFWGNVNLWDDYEEKFNENAIDELKTGLSRAGLDVF